MWPDREDHDTRIDAAIDEAARQMTAGTPGGDFKARVLARVSERESSRAWPLAWLMVPAAGLAIAVIVLILVARPFQHRDGEPTLREARGTPTTTTRESPAPGQPAGQAASRTLEATPETASQTRTAQPPPNQVRATRIGVPSVRRSEVAALAPESLDVESIRLAALPPAASIRVAPLAAIDPIEVTPLAAPDSDEPQRREP